MGAAITRQILPILLGTAWEEAMTPRQVLIYLRNRSLCLCAWNPRKYEIPNDMDLSKVTLTIIILLGRNNGQLKIRNKGLKLRVLTNQLH